MPAARAEPQRLMGIKRIEFRMFRVPTDWSRHRIRSFLMIDKPDKLNLDT
jgi:hypothetical protein